jgi:hypothetical protein
MKKTNPNTSGLVMLVLSAFCAACSGGSGVARQPEKQTREYSPDEKSAARALSINQVRAVTNPASPYARAVLCKNSLDLVAERFRDSSVMNSQQQQQLQQAQAYFDQQVRTLAGQQGLSNSDLRDDLARAARDHSDDEESARTAVACLQGLQKEG